MAKVSTFGFTNTSDSANIVKAKALMMTQNYSLIQDDADVVKLSNKTAPIDQEELVAYRSRNIKNVASDLNIQYPSPVKSGVEYSLRIDALLSTTDSDNPNFRIDEPIVCTIAFRHPKSGNITGTTVGTVFQRAISSLMKSDGTWRFDDLMRSAERPVVD